MKLTFLGTSHGITEKNAFCSSTLVSVGDRHYVIDAGAPVMTLLQNFDVPIADVRGIFITHSHGDHIAGLAELTRELEVFGNHFGGIRLPVYVPDEAVYRRMSYFLFGKEEFRQHRVLFKKYGDGVIFDDGTVKITAIPNAHMANSHSFVVDAQGKRVVFTGDLAAGMPDYPAVITGEHSDLVVCEGAHTRLNKPEVEQLLAKSKTDRLIVHHRAPLCNTDEGIAEFAEAMRPYFPVLLAHDGMTVVI